MGSCLCCKRGKYHPITQIATTNRYWELNEELNNDDCFLPILLDYKPSTRIVPSVLQENY